MPHEIYRFDAQLGTWERKHAAAEPFPYNDGDEPEQYIWRCVAGAADIGCGSMELARSIRDWPSLYHLSPLRANLLRPLAPLLRGCVLEVGPGCGALTRYLGETASTVVAVEGSRRRAAITASRCRDLENVTVVCDDFNGFEDNRQFDSVLLIGVLEYSRTLGSGPAGPAELLSRCCRFLKPDGRLIIAIENQLGIKYFVGAPEDHLGVPYRGVEDLYAGNSPVTWGRRELMDMLERSGIRHVDFLYPFPDYKLPRAVVSHGFLCSGEDDLISGLLAQFGGATHDALPYLRQFSEAAAWQPLVRNGLVADLANSFLCVASQEAVAPQANAAVYSTNRRRAFQCETVFRRRNGAVHIEKRRLYEAADPPRDERFSWRIPEGAFIPGNSYFGSIERVFDSADWTIAAVSAAMRPYADLLRLAADARDSRDQTSPAIPGEYLDCTPANLILAPDGSLRVFDLEWLSAEPLPIAYVYFRGILSVLAHVTAAAPTPHVADRSFLAVARALMESAGFSLSDAEVAEYSQREADFQAFALGRDSGDACAWTRAQLRMRAQSAVAECEGLRAEMARVGLEYEQSLAAIKQRHQGETAALAHEMKQLREAARDLALAMISARSD